MIETIIADSLIQTGALGAICLFFMVKDIKKDTQIVATLEKLTTIIDERLPRSGE